MRPPPTRIGNGGRYFRTNASMGPESRSSDTPAISKSLRSNSRDRKSTRLNSSHGYISYAVFCLKKKKIHVAEGVMDGTERGKVAALEPRARRARSGAIGMVGGLAPAHVARASLAAARVARAAS